MSTICVNSYIPAKDQVQLHLVTWTGSEQNWMWLNHMIWKYPEDIWFFTLLEESTDVWDDIDWIRPEPAIQFCESDGCLYGLGGKCEEYVSKTEVNATGLVVKFERRFPDAPFRRPCKLWAMATDG